MRLVIDTLGERLVARDLVRFAGRAVNTEPAMSEIADLLRTSMTRQFDSQGRYGSRGWRRLRPATRAYKRLAGLDPRILHATLRLRDSLTEKGHADQVEIVRPDGIDFGTRVFYAFFHQFGTVKMVRRRPAQLPEADRRQVVRILQEYLIDDPTVSGSRR